MRNNLSNARPLLAPLVALALGLGPGAEPSRAQLTKVGEIVLASNEKATGVSVEGVTAVASLFTDGEQRIVDLTNPANPTLTTGFNPVFGDQWNENITRSGTFVNGLRFGGLNLWDVSFSIPVLLDWDNTNYHHDGLDILDNAAQRLLFYSEHNAFGNPGGLLVYDITAATLNQIGSSLVGNNQRDGRFLVVTRDQYVYQLDGGAGSTRPLNLNVYDVTNPNAPVHDQMFNMGNIVGNYSGGTDLLLHPTQQVLYAASGFDGLRILDISVPCTPVVANTVSGPSAYLKELDWLDGSVLMAVSARLAGGQWRFRIFDASAPLNPVPVGLWNGDVGYEIRDLEITNLVSGPAVVVVGQNAVGEATLQVWM